MDVAKLTKIEARYLSAGLRRLGFKSYRGYLLSASWRRRSRAFRKARCQGCGKKGRLQVHHKTYRHLGAELEWELLTLCDTCHRSIHGLRPRRARRRRK